MDIRKRQNLWRSVIGCMSLMLLQLNSPFVHADGDETLGPPSVFIESGTGIAAAGVGLSVITQPGTINLDVPAKATVKQVLLYWEGRHGFPPGEGDNTATVNGAEVTGMLIGKAASGSADSSAYRADITSLNAVKAGANSVDIGGVNFTGTNHGAGIVVIFDERKADTAAIDLRDGNDFAFFAYSGQQNTTVPQTYNFEAAGEDRVATLILFFSSVSGTASSGSALDFRPTAIEITVGGITSVFDNELDSKDGQEWDTVTASVLIPAGETSLTVQALSVDNGADIPSGTNRDIPASFRWITSSLAITPDLVPGRMTGGGKQITVDNARITRGFTIHCDIRLSNNIEVNWESDGESNRWHLAKPITSADCSDDPRIKQKPPAAPIDTFEGEGTGRLNGEDGSIIRFVFVDAGEPGVNDTASIRIWAPGVDPDAAGAPDPVLEVSGFLDNGNIQAHYDQPHKGKKK